MLINAELGRARHLSACVQYVTSSRFKGLINGAEYTLSPVLPLTYIPDSLDSVVAAPLLCGMRANSSSPLAKCEEYTDCIS